MISFFLEKIFTLLVRGKWSDKPGTFSHGQIRRILAVRNDNVGDVLCSTPAVRSLRRAFPQAYLAALVVRYSEDAITGNPDLDEVFVYEKAKHRPDRSRWVSLYKQFRILWEVRKKRFDLVIGLRSAFSWSEAWLVYFSGAPWRLGYAPVKKIDTWYRFFYNLKADPRNLKGHEVQRVLGLVRAIGIKAWDERLIVDLPEKARRETENFLKKNGIQPGRLIGFHLSGRRASCRWTAGKWVALANLLQKEHFSVVLTWGPADLALAEEIRSQGSPGILMYPTASLKQLGALQERCRIFVCPDGGAMHFSAAVGTLTVALFDGERTEWGPWGPGHVVLQNGSDVSAIAPEEVHAQILKLLEN